MTTDPRLTAYASLGAQEREVIVDDLLDFTAAMQPEDRRGATLVIHRFMRMCRAQVREKRQAPKQPTRTPAPKP